MAVEKRKGGRLRVRRAMRIIITMSTSNSGRKNGKKREENYDQDLNKHECTKGEQEES